MEQMKDERAMVSNFYKHAMGRLLTWSAAVMVFGTTARAAESDYNSGYESGADGIAYGQDLSWWYLGQYLSDPTWQNWDAYIGYVNGYNGSPVGYEHAERWPLIQPVVDAVSSQQQTVQGTNRIAQGALSTIQSVRTARTHAAGGAVEPMLTVDMSYASVEDQRLDSWANGSDVVGSVMYSAGMGDNASFGLAYAHNEYKVKSVAWEEEIEYLDMFLNYNISEHMTVGVFLDFSHTDIEHIDTFDRWGGGLVGSYGFEATESIHCGLTGVLSSMNKSSIVAFGDDEDSAGLLMADTTFWMSDALSFTAYGSYFALLDRETAPGATSMDGSYFTYGGEFSIKAGDSLSFTVGYETIAADNYRREDRAIAGLTMLF